MLKRFIITILLLVAVAHAGCGPSAQQKTLRTTLDSLNAARDGFLAWDREHQMEIVAKAPTRATGQQELADYRAKRLNVETAFVAAYGTLALAAVEVKARSVEAAVKAATETLTAIAALRSGP